MDMFLAVWVLSSWVPGHPDIQGEPLTLRISHLLVCLEESLADTDCVPEPQCGEPCFCRAITTSPSVKGARRPGKKRGLKNANA